MLSSKRISLLSRSPSSVMSRMRERSAGSGIAAPARSSSAANGVADRAARMLRRPVRTGRPLGISGLPEAAKGSAFAVAAGLLVYPQAAHLEHFEQRRRRPVMTGTGGYFARVGQWLRESF